jgi:hypothetical protein
MTRRRRLALAAAAVAAGALLVLPASAAAHGRRGVAVHLGGYYGYGFGPQSGLGWGWGWGWGPNYWPPCGGYAPGAEGGVDAGLAMIAGAHAVATSRDGAIAFGDNRVLDRPGPAGHPMIVNATIVKAIK